MSLLDPIPPEKTAKPASSGWSPVRDRFISGLVFLLPIVVTCWVFYFVYETFHKMILQPAGHVVQFLFLKAAGQEAKLAAPGWWEDYASPLLAVCAAVGLVYLLGYFVRTRVLGALDWIFSRMPGAKIVYNAARNMSRSMESYQASPVSKRIVLVPYPHSGMRTPAFVSKVLRDLDTGEAILCVWIMTNAWTMAGVTLFVPETEVIDTDWKAYDLFQFILSGGVTSPTTIRYRSGGPTRLIVPGVDPNEPKPNPFEPSV